MCEEALRVVLGMTALLCAGSQLVMRFYLASGYPESSPNAKKEYSTSIAAALMLIGVGVANLTHLNAPLSLSTAILSVALIVVAYNQVDLWRAVKYRISQEHNPPEEGIPDGSHKATPSDR